MIPPVVKEVMVPVSAADAFQRFTDEIHLWWPMRTHSIGRDDCRHVVLESGVGGKLYEVSGMGDKGPEVWGTVTRWDPPHSLSLSWHPGRTSSTAQEVEVEFEEVNGGTRVRLVHRGWEALGERAVAARADYEGGWLTVLTRYAAAFEAAPA
jgi:uncharacterized protein YndB with AHSA1/START domain